MPISFPSVLLDRRMEFPFTFFHLIFDLKTILKVLAENENARMVKVLFMRE